MTRKEAEEIKATYEGDIANIKDRIKELDAIIVADIDPRVGKFFWFWDIDPSIAVIETFAREDTDLIYRFTTTAGRSYAHGRPVEVSDFQDKILNIEKTTRYDWATPNIPSWVRYWTTDENGHQNWWKTRPTQEGVLSGGSWKRDLRYRNTRSVTAFVNKEWVYCPDWRESLEERPEEI